MFYYNIASGSKGNCTIIMSKNTLILVDVGLTFKAIKEALESLGKDIKDIDAIFITHEHSDHIKGLKFFSPKIIYSLEGTCPSLCNTLKENKTIKIKNIEITPFKISHDAINPAGYYFNDGNETMFYLTDTGCFDPNLYKEMRNPTYIYIESNHDIKMLMNTNRPYELKERIMSNHGHLCNEDSAYIASYLVGDNTKEILLAHLSEEANTPELALKAYKDILSKNHISLLNLNIRCLNQHISTFGGNKYED